MATWGPQQLNHCFIIGKDFKTGVGKLSISYLKTNTVVYIVASITFLSSALKQTIYQAYCKYANRFILCFQEVKSQK